MTCSLMVKRWLTAALICTGIAALTGCGTGGGSNGGGRTAGIEGTGITSGFGSVYVGGIEFATENATFINDGEPSSEQALRVGDVVTVQGEIDADGNARAQRIVFDRALEGPIARIDRQPDGTGELVVLGRRVRFDANTHFIPDDTDADTLSTGDRVAISGIGNENDILRATAVERVGDDTSTLAVEGRITALTSTSFRIRDLTIDYSGATLGDGALREDDYVRVTGRQLGAASAALIAERVSRPDRRIGADAQRVFVQGAITDLVDRDQFTVAGQRIDASNAERIGATDAPLAGGETILVKGIRRGDVIEADTLRIESEPNVTLRAPLDTVDGADERVVLLGSQWTIKAYTRYIDQTAPRERKLRLNRLDAGDTIQAVGYEGSDGLVMTRLDRIPADAVGNAFLRAPVESVQREGTIINIGLAGTTVTADAGRTLFTNAAGQTITASAFVAAAVPGTRIAVEGPPNPDRINVARTVKLLD